MRRSFFNRNWVVLAAMLLVAGAGDALAQGWIQPPENFRDFGVSRERTVISVNVEGRLAHIEVEEWFRNDGPRLGEGTYFYPLSGDATFQSFSLFQGDQELRGETMDANQARSIYEEIVRARRDPALIELAGNGLIRARVFPINPGERRKITLRYSQLLSREGDALQFRYLAARATGPLAGGSQSAIDRNAEVSFTLHASSEVFADAYSPTHTINSDRTGGEMVVRSVGSLDGNLSLFLPFANESVGVSLVTHRPVGEDGFFMMTLSPNAMDGAALPRDVTVVVDVSGSMSGTKLDQARRAIVGVLRTLSHEDRFRLLAFSNSVRQYSGAFVDASADNVQQAERWVNSLDANGGTNINEALTQAFRIDSPDNRLPIVLFLTDGLPTVGVQNADQIIRNASNSRGEARVFSFGVGYDVNTFLLDELGTAGRGDTQYVEPGEDIEIAVSSIARKISRPVLSNLVIAQAPGELYDMYPSTLPDLFSGEELIVFGRYRDAGSGALAIAGNRGNRTERFGTDVVLPIESPANEFIPRLWAARKLGWMSGELRRNPQNEELRTEIRNTAMRYGLLSEFTSYLVQEPTVVADEVRPMMNAPAPLSPGARPMRMEQARNRSGGAGFASASGEMAVQQAAREAERRSTVSLADLAEEDEVFNANEIDGLRRVFGRTFRERDGIWYDVAFDDTRPSVKIAPFSAAYFRLLELAPEYRTILADFEQVALAGEGVNLEIVEGGAAHMDDGALNRLVRRMRGN